MLSHRWADGGLTIRNLSGRRARSGRGLIMLGGWTATVDYWGGEMAGNEDGVTIARAAADFAESGSRGLLTTSCATDSTWGNQTIRDRITDLVDACQASGYFPAGRVNLFGNSMGGICVLNWAIQNPTRVASIGLCLASLDIQYLYDNNTLGTAASISAAHGGRPPDIENPADHPEVWAPFPIKVFYSTTDITPLATTQAFIAATGAESESMGAVGHTWGDKSVFNGAALARFAHRYGS